MLRLSKYERGVAPYRQYPAPAHRAHAEPTLSSRGPARDLRHQPTTQLPPLTHTTTSLIPPPCRPRKPPHEVRSILGWTNQPQEKEGWGSSRPEPRRRILRAEREGSFLVTATVLTHNPVIPRPREGSKAPAHHPATSSSTQPRPLSLRHAVPESPLTKYVPFWGGPTSPKKRKGGVPLALSSVEGSQERNGAGPFLVAAHRLPSPIIQTPPTNTPPHPYCLLLKTPLPPPPNTSLQYFALYRLCLPHRVKPLCTRHKDTYNTCQPSLLNSGTPPRCQPCATTQTPFSLATNSAS